MEPCLISPLYSSKDVSLLPGSAQVFGGRVTSGLNELHAYSTVTDTWELLTPAGTLPSRRHSHVAVWTGSFMIAPRPSGVSVPLFDLFVRRFSRTLFGV